VNSDPILAAITAFVVFVFLAALVAIAIRRFAVPYSVALVAVGLAVGIVLPGQDLGVTPELVLVVLLPGLVFEAAFRIDLHALKKTFVGVTLLAVPGVLIVAGVVSFTLYLGSGLPLELGLIVGATVAATDPAAVIATFKRLAVPRRLAALTEGESLFNDGTGLVLFALAVSAIGTSVTAIDVAETLVVTIVTSVIIGGVTGYVASRLMAIANDHLIELTISVAAAYGTYLLADVFHDSGVIATVIAGIIIGNYGRRNGISERAAVALDTVWEFVAYLLTALVFMLVGLSISLSQLATALPWIGWGIAGVLVGRAIVVYVMLGGAWRLRWSRSTLRADRGGWLNVLFWSGLRGAVAVAMALSLPDSIPQRELLQGDHLRHRALHPGRPGHDNRAAHQALAPPRG
jgi:CPA1 family monovalent cation:H+ antiporter